MTYVAPVAQWPEPPETGALTLVRAGWAYDGPSDTYTLTTVRSTWVAELVDVGSTGTYTLVAMGTSLGAPRAKVTQTVAGTTHIY